jgi:hypothetical protein
VKPFETLASAHELELPATPPHSLLFGWTRSDVYRDFPSRPLTSFVEPVVVPLLKPTTLAPAQWQFMSSIPFGAGTSVTCPSDVSLGAILARTTTLKLAPSTKAPRYADSEGGALRDIVENQVAQATSELDAFAVRKLLVLVDRWQSLARESGAGGGKTFTALNILDGQHRQMALRYDWYRRWSLGALPTVFLGRLEERLRDFRTHLVRRRRQLHVRPVRRVLSALTPRLSAQLQCLAHFIIAHAPPGGCRIPVPAGAGGRTT